MTFWKTAAYASAVAVLSSTTAMADCGIDAGRVSIVGNEFPAIQTVAAGAAACATDSVEVEANLTADHQKINLPGMQGSPAEYTSAIIANSSIVALMNEDVIRPLDDLVAKHGEGLARNQLITINGEVMAVAFMANAQHLVYRADVLEQVGVEPPKTYEEMLEAAKMIREQGIMDNPLGGAYAAGWNLAQEFNNMFIGYGGTFFKDGTAEPNVNTEAGETIEEDGEGSDQRLTFTRGHFRDAPLGNLPENLQLGLAEVAVEEPEGKGEIPVRFCHHVGNQMIVPVDRDRGLKGKVLGRESIQPGLSPDLLGEKSPASGREENRDENDQPAEKQRDQPFERPANIHVGEPEAGWVGLSTYRVCPASA